MAEKSNSLCGEFWKVIQTAWHSIRNKTFTMYDTGDGWKVSSYLSSHWGCTGRSARWLSFSKVAEGERTHIHFNTLSSGKKTLETGMVCNSEEYFKNPSSMASTKFNEKCSQFNKAEILTTIRSKCTEEERVKLLNPP